MPSIALSPATVRAGDTFTVSGSGFEPGTNVLIGFVAGGWGSPVAQDGTFSISDIPAMSGDTLPVGQYPVEALQLYHKRWRTIAEATLTVVP